MHLGGVFRAEFLEIGVQQARLLEALIFVLNLVFAALAVSRF
jgi:hypothetical protein